jgi:hypothetical protein
MLYFLIKSLSDREESSCLLLICSYLTAKNTDTWKSYTYICTYCNTCTVGYNDFDLFLENKESRLKDGCKIEFQDTFMKNVFRFYEAFRGYLI